MKAARFGSYGNLVIFHVGGGGINIGPAEALYDLFEFEIDLYLFEIREEENSQLAVRRLPKVGNINVFKVNAGISDGIKKASFYVNNYPMSSSMLRPSEISLKEFPNFDVMDDNGSRPVKNWEENTTLSHEIPVSLTSIDNLVSDGLVPYPDFLSMDIQGSEFDALKGSINSLQKSVLGVATETEFFEIYENQKLYADIAQLLKKFSFRLMELSTFQQWYPGPAAGKGFPTVAEPVFILFSVNSDVLNDNGSIRRLEDLTTDTIMKLAAISFAFGRLSYFYSLFNFLRNHRATEFSLLQERPILRRFFVAFFKIDGERENWEVNPRFLLENPNLGKWHSFLNWNLRVIDFLLGWTKVRSIVYIVDKRRGRFGDIFF